MLSGTRQWPSSWRRWSLRLQNAIRRAKAEQRAPQELEPVLRAKMLFCTQSAIVPGAAGGCH